MSKGRIFLFHWNQAEADGYANDLRAKGWDVDVEAEDGARGGAAVKLSPPDAVVFYLRRLPSHSRATAEHLSQAKATRSIPLVFVDGEGEALTKIKAKFPRAAYTSSADLPKVLSAQIVD
jgi:hypothetical protein